MFSFDCCIGGAFLSDFLILMPSVTYLHFCLIQEVTFPVTVYSLKYFFTLFHKCNRQNSQTPHPQLKSTQQVRRHVWSEQETSYMTILLRCHWSTHPVSGSHWMRVMPRPVALLKVYLRMMFAHNSGSHTRCSQLPCPVTQTPLPCSIPGRPVIITVTHHERGTLTPGITHGWGELG